MGGHSNIPVPDPSTLTTEALARGLQAERVYVDGKIELIERALADLKEHFEFMARAHAAHDEAQFTAQKEAVASALASAEKAVAKAEIANDHRFEAVETLRNQLSLLQQTVILRAEYNVQHSALADRLSTVESNQRENNGRSQGLQAGWAYLIGAVGALAGIVGLVIAFRG